MKAKATEFNPGRVIARMLGKLPFLGHLALTSPREVGTRVPTAATDGEKLYFNADWMSELSLMEQAFVYSHELLHITLQHALRRPSDCTTPERRRIWNVAADHVINLSLLSADLPMPSDEDGNPIGYADPQYSGWYTEQVYRHLLQEQQDEDGDGDGDGDGGNDDGEPRHCDDGGDGEPHHGGGDGGDGDGGDGEPRHCDDGNGEPSHHNDLMPPNPKDGETAHDVAQRVRGRIKNAANIAGKQDKGIGSLPAEVAALIEQLFEPIVDWREVLRSFFVDLYPTHETWARLNRRLRVHGQRWPSTHKEPSGDVSVLIDTSGSVHGEIVHFLSELKGIMDDVEPNSIHVRFWDVCELLHVETTCEDWQVDMGGCLRHPPLGGGTDLSGGIQEADGDEADVIIVFTDGHTPWCQPVDTPMLTVLLKGGAEPPFGDSITYDPSLR